MPQLLITGLDVNKTTGMIEQVHWCIPGVAQSGIRVKNLPADTPPAAIVEAIKPLMGYDKYVVSDTVHINLGEPTT